MKHFKLLLPLTLILTIILTIGFITVAWYIYLDRVTNMDFKILQIDSLVALYEADDSNYNGVPDRSTTANINKYYRPEDEAYVSYRNQYYDEYYAFKYVDQKYALSQDSEANLLEKLTIVDAIPTKIYSYKFEITNYVGNPNDLAFSFIEDNNIDTSILKDFEVRLGVIDETDGYIFSSWTDFTTKSGNTYSYSGITLNPLDDTMVVPAQTQDLSVGRLDLWLQVRLKEEATNSSISEFALPKYRIALTFSVPDSE